MHPSRRNAASSKGVCFGMGPRTFGEGANIKIFMAQEFCS